MSLNPTSLVPLSRGWAADASPQGLVALSRDGTVLYANPAMERMLGASEGGLLGRHAGDFHAIPELAASMARDRRVGDRIQGLELALRTLGDEEVSVRISATLLKEGPAGAALVAAVEDISTLRIRESSESQARTMDAVGRLAGGMAHHFNNLLASILGHADLLKDAVAGQEEALGSVDPIIVAARRAKEIADLLLIVSGKEVGARRRVDLGGWIYEAASRVRPSLPGDVELVVRAEAGEHPVRMDPGRLSQIVNGLVSNAEEALPDGGTILLEVARWSPESASDAHLFSPPPGGGPFVCLTVADDGMGMNEETLSRALEPFFSTRRDREGAGLGLATIYGITVQSGGHVSIESAPVVGTRVRVLLPEAGVERAATPDAPSLMAEGWTPPVEAPGSDPWTRVPSPVLPEALVAEMAGALEAGPRATADVPEPPAGVEDRPPGVLVVDDEETIRNVMVKLLKRSGFEVFTAEDGREAQRVFLSEPGRIQMVVTDVMMPRMNGVELLEWLGEVSAETPTLMVSGFAGSPLVQPWVDRDPDAFLAKPFEAPEFLDRIRTRYGALPRG